jgi:hypothetical protein
MNVSCSHGIPVVPIASALSRGLVHNKSEQIERCAVAKGIQGKTDSLARVRRREAGARSAACGPSQCVDGRRSQTERVSAAPMLPREICFSEAPCFQPKERMNWPSHNRAGNIEGTMP